MPRIIPTYNDLFAVPPESYAVIDRRDFQHLTRCESELEEARDLIQRMRARMTELEG